MAAQLYKTESGRLFHAGAICVITVGLPASGKTHSTRLLLRFMRWLGVSTEIFSVGEYRRKHLNYLPKAEWFDQSNIEGAKIRSQLAKDCLNKAIEWLLHRKGQIAIFDANNVTKARREFIYQQLIQNNIQPLFIEFICTDPAMIMKNILKVKVASKDYEGWALEDAISDYKERIERNKSKYQTIEETQLYSFIKIIDAGKQLRINKVEGYLCSKIVYFLLNIHVQERTIYLARAGDAGENNHSYKIDAPLSKQGEAYANRLAQFMKQYRDLKMVEQEEKNDTDHHYLPESQIRSFTVWTSTRRKGIQTALPFSKQQFPILTMTGLTQLNPGECDGLSEQEIDLKFPEEVLSSKRNPYCHRYPRGEVKKKNRYIFFLFY
ncbi:6-phosphofructo-2-kinase-domain-containing protein, partial [Cunninghamella echinulata]